MSSNWPALIAPFYWSAFPLAWHSAVAYAAWRRGQLSEPAGPRAGHAAHHPTHQPPRHSGWSRWIVGQYVALAAAFGLTLVAALGHFTLLGSVGYAIDVASLLGSGALIGLGLFRVPPYFSLEGLAVGIGLTAGVPIVIWILFVAPL